MKADRALNGPPVDRAKRKRCVSQPAAFTLIEKDFFSFFEPGIFKPLIQSLLEGGDHYMLLADLRPYIEAQERVDRAYRDVENWTRMAILNVARAGRFSSDRTIAEYAREIWRLEPSDGTNAKLHQD